jgi:hypothetical protein
MPRQVQAPARELRFTRSGQAPAFWVAAAVLAAAAMSLVACGLYRDVNPLLPHPAWAAIPLALAWAALRTAVRLTRHAYLILTPLGLEIFPFFRPATTMRLVTWAEIHSAEVDGELTRLTLHHNAEKSSGIHLSLKPIRADKLPLLVQALAGRIKATPPAPAAPGASPATEPA